MVGMMDEVKMEEDVMEIDVLELEAEESLLVPPELDLKYHLEKVHSSLLEAVALESKYQPALSLPLSTKGCSEITWKMRNGSVHVLRCLKVWYDLPSETFFNGVNVMDRFLTRMRAQPKHLSCIAVSAFHLACQFTRYHIAERYKIPDRANLTNISQAKCSPGDVSRMEKIMVDKLDTNFRMTEPITAISLLRLYYAAHAHLAALYLPNFPSNHHPSLVSLKHKLEIIACDTAFTVYKPSEISLAVLAAGLESEPHKIIHQAIQMHFQQICKIDLERFEACRKIVRELIEQYENQRKSPHHQRLVWRLSHRTLRLLRPTKKFKQSLPTIQEKHPQPHPIIKARMESSDYLSEEEMEFDYDQEFPPLPPPSVSLRSPRKLSSHKKQQTGFPYPKVTRKHGRTA